MAVRSIQEDASHSNDAGVANGTEAVTGGALEKKEDPDKRFRPNPDAKPFIPNPLTLAANKGHYHATEKRKDTKGVVPPYWMQPHVNHDNVILPGSTHTGSNAPKKHIAFNIVSNVLDDEVPEDTSKNHMKNGSHNHSDVYGNGANCQVDSWQTSVSNFTLPLGSDSNYTLALGSDSNFTLPLGSDSNFTLPPCVDKNYAKESINPSINKKTLHEIWSPNPSPSEEIISMYQTQQQLLDSPTSKDTPEPTFEQLQNGLVPSSDTTTELVQNYDELVNENNEEEEVNPNLNYYYQDMQSAMYSNQYENNDHAEFGDQYQAMFLHENGGMAPSNDANSMVLNQNDYYEYTQYFDGHQNGNQNGNQSGNTRYHEPKKRKPLKSSRLNYDMKMSYVEELGISLDECNDQLKHLEIDFSKADASLIQEFRLPRSPGSDGGSARYPQNASRVDKLVIESQREHQKVESLIGRIERHRFATMHSNVSVALDMWLSCVKDLRNIRKNELANIRESAHFRGGNKPHVQGDICKMIACVNGLTKHTRSARTIVWCALQMIYANITNGSTSGE